MALRVGEFNSPWIPITPIGEKYSQMQWRIVGNYSVDFSNYYEFFIKNYSFFWTTPAFFCCFIVKFFVNSR